MNYENWKNKAQGFQTVDVRHIQGSFFEGLKKRSEALEICLSNCLRCPHIYRCAFRPCCGYYPYLLLCNTVNSRSLL